MTGGETKLTHLSEAGAARMVDVGEKPISRRTATAVAVCVMQPETVRVVQEKSGHKGDVLQVARIAAIGATKRTDELIPLCHSVPLDTVQVEFDWIDAGRLQISVTCVATGRTGVEMESLVGASMAALTVYDMCKAIDRGMMIETVSLLSKTGGVRGDYTRVKEET